MLQLDDAERDAVQEIFNIGVGASAAALSEMIGEEVLLSVPDFSLVEVNEVATVLGSDSGSVVCGVDQRFETTHGNGHAILMFPERQSLELVQALLGSAGSSAEMTELEQEALTEVGNIILNACISSLGDWLGEEVAVDLPMFQRGARHTLLVGEQAQRAEAVMLIMIRFELRERALAGQLAFLLELESLQSIVKRVFASFS